ncbi:hypothetical protein DFJ77DRAFT_552162 [Powellomyces hirtus]|nr:hypothetical protein DFJ77DRAFT_552162 [Powellomyces hirtus]
MAKRRIIESESEDDFQYTPNSKRQASTPGSRQSGRSVLKHQSSMDMFVTKSPTKAAAKPSVSNTPVSATSPAESPQKRTTLRSLASMDGEAIRKEMLKKGEEQELPPMKDLPDMFYDLVKKMPLIADVARRLNGRKLRVATMCSGTESPLLALELISRAIKQCYGVSFEVEHVFSCEIEPFKQAYIERNFAPPLLFRDVCELGGDEATTAYGALRKVPGNVDLLVAGTSCVDFSNLNNQKKKLADSGESGRTFRGMLQWVAKHRPPLIILENVVQADWKGSVQPAIEKHGYRVKHTNLDTKHYYIPHTRTRGYLFAVDKEVTHDRSYPDTWLNVVRSLTRPASVPVEALLLQEDDPRVQKARDAFVQAAQQPHRGRTEWVRCESRHKKARDEEHLGTLRPLTEWQDGGVCTLLQSSWQEWANVQTERVLDLMDISYIRLAIKDNVDASFKTLVWNLSQNVDRTTGSGIFGISPCLTPSMIPYITTRGGPLTGLEALSLQGLPIDELLLTRESLDQLSDLAGNAMSTTVVGTCMLSAMVVAMDALKPGDGNSDVKPEMELTEVPISKIVGQEQLKPIPYDLVTCRTVGTIASILDEAKHSARLCGCEGRGVVQTCQIRVCQDCGVTSCEKCGKRPKHNYVPITYPRMTPAQFEENLKGVLPMRLAIEGFVADLLDELIGQLQDYNQFSWNLWRNTAIEALKDAEFRFRILKRQEIWVAVYEAPKATLELLIDPIEPEWRLFVNAPYTENVNSPLRELFSRPVARMMLTRDSTDFLSGQWRVYLPVPKSFYLTMQGAGELVPSWKARLGAQGGLENEKWWSKMIISEVPEHAQGWLERDIAGSYTLFEKCGTAMCALHKKDADDTLDGGDEDGEQKQHALLMFLDPTRAGKPEDDPFVFSTSSRALAYQEVRVIAAQLDSSWRPSAIEGPQEAECHVPVRRCDATGVRFVVPLAEQAMFSLPESALSLDTHACDQAIMLLNCSVPLTYVDSLWPQGHWADIELLHKGRKTFETLAWITERLPHFEHLEQWMDMGTAPLTHTCERCAPTPPDLRWQILGGNRLVPIEDPIQAGPYEQALKNRPQPFVAQLRCDDHTGTLRIGANVATLLHRALSNLKSEDRTNPAQLSWRLTNEYTIREFPAFTLKSNRPDPQHPQPPHFKKFPLRPEQLRSLSWMLEQEKEDAEPFIEEEISEAVLEPLRLRVEAKAERPVLIRGGVLADQVGYGKTAITLGLIDCAKAPDPLPIVPGAISIKATLIVVPGHLSKQWPSEIRKFTGSAFNVLAIETVANMNRLTIADFQNADIIVVASRMLKSDTYWKRLAGFAGDGELPAGAGRRFILKYESALKALRRQVEALKLGTEGLGEVIENIERGRTFKDPTIVQVSKRLSAKECERVGEGGGEEESIVVEEDDDEVDEEDEDEDGPFNLSSKRKAKTALEPKPRAKRAATTRKRPVINLDTTEDEDEEEEEDVKDEEDYIPLGTDSDNDNDETESLEEGVYEVERILDADDPGDGSGVMYQVKWKGYPIEDATWEPASNVEHLEEMLDEWEERKKNLRARKAAPTSKKAAAAAAPVKKEKIKKPAAAPTKKVPAVKKTTRKTAPVEIDPWGLRSAAVRKNWRHMKCPSLEMFHFHRLVIDEYTYLDGQTHASVTHLQSTLRWILSGTPPQRDFRDIKSIATFLGVNLGLDDHVVTRKDQNALQATAAEKFLSFREVHTTAWHAHRHELAQLFLDRFVRQNIAEIDEIPAVEHLLKIRLPAAERAIYLELEHHLQAMEMDTKKTLKTNGDKEKRLREAMGSSKTAEEALLKRCSHFDLHVEQEVKKKSSKTTSSSATTTTTTKLAPTRSDAREACQVIVAERTAQLDECKQSLLGHLIEANKHHQALARRGAFKDAPSPFIEWRERWLKGQDVGDPEAVEIFHALLAEAGVGEVNGEGSGSGKDKGKGKVITSSYFDMMMKGGGGGGGKSTPKNKPKPKTPAKKPAKKPVVLDTDEEDSEEYDDGSDDCVDSVKIKKSTTATTLDDDVWRMREMVHDLRRLVKELTGRVRSLRYFTLVRDFQQAKLAGREARVYPCPGCANTVSTATIAATEDGAADAMDGTPTSAVPAQLAVLSCCGHTGCSTCLTDSAANQKCPVAGCEAAARVTNVVLASVIGAEDENEELTRYGKKLSQLVKLIKSLPKDERVLVFVQFDDLMVRVAEALLDANIKFLHLQGSTTAKSSALAKFQDEDHTSTPRVLLLNVMTESASGANLTIANHAIFLSPLLAETQHEYTAAEVQAIGRVRRYGQKKTVHIHRFLTMDTMDMQIWESRERTELK